MTLSINGKTYEAGELIAYHKRLEKENAELKARVEKQNTDILVLKHLSERQRDRLTKAKEIIKLLLHALKNEGSDYTFALENTHPALEEAEQFLKDCDIDNAIQQANKGLDFDKIADEMEQDLKDSEVVK